MGLIRHCLLAMVLASIIALPLAFAADSASGVLSSSLCSVVNSIRAVVGIIALMLFILGGALYAIAHMLPAAGNLKGSVQGWSLGMIIGGIVGLIIVLIAPWMLTKIISVGSGVAAGTINC